MNASFEGALFAIGGFLMGIFARYLSSRIALKEAGELQRLAIEANRAAREPAPAEPPTSTRNSARLDPAALSRIANALELRNALHQRRPLEIVLNAFAQVALIATAIIAGVSLLVALGYLHK